MGFDMKFLDMVQECISRVKFSILLNGASFGFFNAKQGIRQGDSLSLTLFTIFSDLLSRLLDKAVNDNRISSIKVARTSPRISHLMYVDDLVIYCKANEQEATEVYSILE